MQTLADLAVNDTLDLAINGVSYEFTVAQQGKPDDSYDDSCDGTWLMMTDLYTDMAWGSASTNKYSASDVNEWLNDDFLALLDANTRACLQTVKIPVADGSTVLTGANGLEVKAFLPSAREVGWVASSFPVEGSCLAFFSGFSNSDDRRMAYDSTNTSKNWFTRTYVRSSGRVAGILRSSGGPTQQDPDAIMFLRPVMIFPSTTRITDDGTMMPNSPPTITSPSGPSGADLGTQNAPFYFQYTPSDPDGDTLTVTEYVDGITSRSWTGAGGALTNFEAVTDATKFAQLGIGDHALKVTASDGALSAEYTAAFEKISTSASLTLTSPIQTDGQILSAVIQVEGSIPTDADYSVQLTNNALDTAPVWQDATEASKTGGRVTFTNQTAANGWAFNFKLEVERGASGTGGYISAVSGSVRSVADDSTGG